MGTNLAGQIVPIQLIYVIFIKVHVPSFVVKYCCSYGKTQTVCANNKTICTVSLHRLFGVYTVFASHKIYNCNDFITWKSRDYQQYTVGTKNPYGFSKHVTLYAMVSACAFSVLCVTCIYVEVPSVPIQFAIALQRWQLIFLVSIDHSHTHKV